MLGPLGQLNHIPHTMVIRSVNSGSQGSKGFSKWLGHVAQAMEIPLESTN